MIGNGVCFAVAETDRGDQGSLARWRDDVLVPGMNGVQSVQRLERYMAFNVKRCALVVNTSEPSDVQPVVAANPGMRFEILNGRKVSEFTAAGQSRIVESASILYSVLFTVPPEWREEFDAWYDQEHIPMMVKCRDWVGAARYHVLNGKWTHLALHYVKDAGAIDSPELRAARTTPGRDRFAAQSWFNSVDKMFYFKQARPR
jgi:hypothetical protein